MFWKIFAREVIPEVIATVSLLIGVILLFTVPFHFLWNWLIPEIFGLKEITIWQSCGLLFLSSLLFKNGNIK